MIAVIFEVRPKQTKRQIYFGLASEFKLTQERIDGFISVERFQSLNDSNKILSLSFFEDEDAMLACRNRQEHRKAQTAGRERVFDDDRLRVASVIRDYGMSERGSAPIDSRKVHDK